MNEKNLEQQLKTLSYVGASEGLKGNIHGLTASLPARHKTFFPLIAFQMGVALAVILLFLGIGSGVVVAAHYSRPGTLFYPVKKAIEALPIPVLKENSTTPMPTVAPTPQEALLHSSGVPTPEAKKERNENAQGQEHEKEKGENHPTIQNVEGAATQSPVASVSPTVKKNGDQEEKKSFDFGQGVRAFFEHVHSSENHEEDK